MDLSHINLIRPENSNKVIEHLPLRASISYNSNISENNLKNVNSKPYRKFNNGECQFEQGQKFNHAEVNCNKDNLTITHCHKQIVSDLVQADKCVGTKAVVSSDNSSVNSSIENNSSTNDRS